jgi:hypothetical protein
MVVVGRVVEGIRDTGATAVKVDVVGIGWGVVGRLQELGGQGVHRATIVPVNVGATSSDPTRFPKLRDQLWWDIGRELSRTRGWDLRGVDDATIGQLIAPRHAPDSAGRTKVEPKDETKARLGRSPDDADALLLAFYDPLVPETDPAFVLGVIKCAVCGEQFVWHPHWWCPRGHPAPAEDPYRDRLLSFDDG